jgi:hypothetical protein
MKKAEDITLYAKEFTPCYQASCISLIEVLATPCSHLKQSKN